MEAVEVEYKETVIPEKKEVIVEKVIKEEIPESAPEIVKEVIITKEEPKVEKVSSKPTHQKKEEKKEIVEEVKEEKSKPNEEEETKKDNTLIFNQVKTEQIEIIKEKPKDEPKKLFLKNHTMTSKSKPNLNQQFNHQPHNLNSHKCPTAIPTQCSCLPLWTRRIQTANYTTC